MRSKTDKFFFTAFTVSLGIHLILLFSYRSREARRERETSESIEVVYKALPAKEEPVEPGNKIRKPLEPVKPVNRPIRQPSLASSALDKPIQPFLDGVMDSAAAKKSGYNIDKKIKPGIGYFDPSRKITVPYLKSEKMSNPRYLSYNEKIRERIRQAAYSFVDDPSFEPGRVYMTFVVQRDGQLRELKVIDAKSSRDPLIREIGKRSIESSTPFHPFPRDLDFPELSFNIVISFKLDD